MIEPVRSYIAQNQDLVTKMATYQVAGFIPSLAWIPLYNIKTDREIQAIKVQSLKDLSRLYSIPRNPRLLWKDAHIIWLNQPLFPLAVYVREKLLERLTSKEKQKPTLKDELMASLGAGAATAPFATANSIVFLHKRHFNESVVATISRLWKKNPKTFLLGTDLWMLRNGIFVTNLTVIYPQTYKWLNDHLNLPPSAKEACVVAGSIFSSATVATIFTNPMDNAIIRLQSTFSPLQAKSSWEALKQPHMQHGWRGWLVALVPRLIAMAVIEQPLIHYFYHRYEPKIKHVVKKISE